MQRERAIEEARARGLDPDTRPNAPKGRTAEHLIARADAEFEREHRRRMDEQARQRA